MYDTMVEVHNYIDHVLPIEQAGFHNQYMHTFKFSVRSQKHHTGKTSGERTVLLLLLCGLLCILGAVTFNADASTKNLLPVARQITPNKSPQTPPGYSPPSRRRIHPLPRQTPQITTKLFTYPVYYGNPHVPEIALTFDDGPNPVYTLQILAILQAYNVKATFFDVGYLVKDFPNIVRQEFLQGHTIGNHSWSHPQLTRLSASGIYSQLVSTSDAIQSVTGKRPTIFRPPYGSFNRIVLSQALRLNLSTIIWNNEAHDWATPGTNVIAWRILNLARYGGIILLHDGGGFRAQTVAALPIIITTLRQRGFTFVTIPQLLHDIVTPGNDLPVALASSASSATALMPILTAWKQE
jgi:peptidoglycan-N-acetylglucosamine deacetylase